MKIEKIDHISPIHAIDEIADNARVDESLGNRGAAAAAEDRLPLPNEDCERENPEHRKRPGVTLEHAPGTAPVFNIGQIEKTWNNGNRRGPLEVSRGEFLEHRVRQNEVRDDRKNRDEAAHQMRLRSISLWHSMHVSPNGWFRSRGLRISCPHTVQTP